ncbi:MAG: hypothetical protein CMM12_03270 [Rhodospirillaceae bacterium]|nr:hypothetical protein [Rhodospirillaceae bacterium]
MSNCYATVTAAVVQIAAEGALGTMIDNLKTRQIDVFASAYFTTRPFAHGHEREANDEPIHVNRTNTIKNRFEVTRSFDLVYMLYLVMDLPGLGNFDSNGKYLADNRPHYTNGHAAALVRDIHVCMGGHSLSGMTGQQIYLFEELAGKPGKRLQESVGKLPTCSSLENMSTRARRLYLPMYYWFCATRGSVSTALNLIGAQFQKCTIDMSLNSLLDVVENCTGSKISKLDDTVGTTYVIDEISSEPMTGSVRRSSGNVFPFGLVTGQGANDGKVKANAADVNGRALSTFTAFDSKYTGARATIDVLGITLNEQDRNTFASKDRMSLMDEIHTIDRSNSQALSGKSTTIDITDHAKNLIYEIQVAARLRTSASGTNYGPMRFDGHEDATTGEVYDPLETMGLTISGQNRTMSNLESQWFNQVAPHMHHSTLPSHSGIYSLPFSLYPEDFMVPDSYANASKLDSMRLNISLPQNTIDTSRKVDVFVFCHAYNILVEQKGMKAKFFV